MALFQDKVGIVTGGGSGIGRAIARSLAEAGGAVVIGDIDEHAAAAAAAELDREGLRAIGIRCDVCDEDSVAGLVAMTVDMHGRLDAMVNNAGTTRDAVMQRMSLADFRAVLDTHLVGVWLGTRAASAAMRAGGEGGSIINMSSISGKVGNAGQTNYSAAKAGVIGLTKAAAKEVARYGVRVNAIQPGLIRSPMTAKMPEDVLTARLAEVPLGRIGEVEDVADVALFLASPLSSYLTGTVLEVTGGRHM